MKPRPADVASDLDSAGKDLEVASEEAEGAASAAVVEVVVEEEAAWPVTTWRAKSIFKSRKIRL